MTNVFWGAIFALLFFSLNHAYASPLDPQWLKLLRYNKFGNSFESEADSPQFFLTPKGKYKPKDEYNELLKRLDKPITGDDHVACIFPARAMKIVSDKKLKPPRFEKCSKLNKFLQTINPKGASLVFASYFIQKPSSAFGHTFLRLHSNTNGNAALLDHAVDFSASVDTQNPIAYGVKGIIGGFKGRFSRMPYFLKIREYADLDSRDVWEYPLDLSTEQLYLLALHLWEMDQAYFDYYYFSENCSYHILRAIEAVTDTDLSQDLKFFVIPIDTIHALNKSNLLGSPNRNPSQYSLVKNGLDNLSTADRNLVHNFFSDPFSFNLNLITTADVLDVLIDTLNYKYADSLLTNSAPIAVTNLRNSILEKRSYMGQFTMPDIKIEVDPLDGHYGSFLDLSYFKSSDSGIYISHAFALHQFNHPSRGYAASSQMLMGFTELKVKKGQIDLKSFHLFDVLSAAPSFGLEFKPGWRFSLGLDRDFAVDESLAPFVLIQSGISTTFNSNTLLTFFVASRPRLETRSNKFYAPLGASAIFIHHLSAFRFGVESNYYRNFQTHKNEFLIKPFLRYNLNQNTDSFLDASVFSGESIIKIGTTFFY